MRFTSLLTIVALALSCALCSCLDDRDDILWREANLNYMASLKDSASIYPLEINDSILSAYKGAAYEPSAPSGVFFKELQPGTGEYPIIGQRVVVSYRGRFYNGNVFDQGSTTFTLGDKTIEGFTLAVQRMREGAEWEVYIPYYLGYGSTETNSLLVTIPAYSALIFKMKLVEIDH